MKIIKCTGVLIAALLFSYVSFAQYERIHICGAGIVNRPDLDAAPLLKECIKNGAGVIELLPGRYYLDSSLELDAKTPLTIRTQGVTSGPACLTEEAKSCAVLTASVRNTGAPIIKSEGAKHLSLRYIALDGNIGPRRAKIGDTNWADRLGYNGMIHNCQKCSFLGFSSVRAARGTGLEFSGDDAVFDHVLFAENGWDLQSAPDNHTYRFADGLTIWSSKNLHITNSIFADNTDIDLIIGNAPNAKIENNVFSNTHSYAFAALMLDNFNNNSAGIFTGAVIRNNRINCQQGLCGIGINLGPHMWYPSKPIIDGEISNNQITGARQGILANGAIGAKVHHNKIQGSFPFVAGSCKSFPLSFSKGDQVEFRENSTDVKASQLESCQPQQLAFSFFSPQGTDTRISKIYREILNRNPDKTGGQFYTRALQSGWKLSDIRTHIANSAECKSLLNEMSMKWLDRRLDSGSEGIWTDYLIKGGTLARLHIALQLHD